MPEIPDIEAYVHALKLRLLGEELRGFRLAAPFLLRTVIPPPSAVVGRPVTRVARLGKRVVLEFGSGIVDAPSVFFVIHLMIAGRLHWKKPGAAVPKGRGLAAFDFPNGTLLLTEAGSKRRASLHVLSGTQALEDLDPGGLELIGSTPDEFAEVLARDNRTLKRALTDPKIISGVGNAYSDEILHRARLSPLKRTRDLTPQQMSTLHAAAIEVLTGWTKKLIEEAEGRFPEKVTAFRPDMAVHGRYGERCPVCDSRVERIRYVENECDYCPGCQTEGRILADRALSRLLKDDWPRERPS